MSTEYTLWARKSQRIENTSPKVQQVDEGRRLSGGRVYTSKRDRHTEIDRSPKIKLIYLSV